MPQLIEYVSKSKTGFEKDMEDTYCVTDNYAAVIDGATNVSGQLIDGKTPGQHAAQLIKQTIESLQGPETIEDIITKINDSYALFYRDYQLTEVIKTKPFLRPSATMALYSAYTRKIWLIGDCQCYVNGQHYQHGKEVDAITSQARRLLVEAELAKGKLVADIIASDTSFEMIKPLIQAQYAFTNQPPSHPFSYEVINGELLYVDSFQVIDVPAGITSLALASDGYPQIFATLKETESHLEHVLQRDPLCIHDNVSVRGVTNGKISYDDRTYINIRIESGS
ncbi:hypothetical protein HXA34_17620 [Salipaludibacillus agaradhaerens]|uniref:hypothetical protein n=1 Tax=Salipaludibacillus agaradhaerens TaxID=76935 RepID=UPI00215133CF|nr:hypothetical protein [Salipaludibacillus agaradhaerens]MCR6108116.1 hypothetical protein [Salipaludibacillus agaradhaerens]MCR6120141.1 hypothetical protein [Salipaludibacillus agaradhaerens]